jgi:hypothetical protein
MALPTIDFVAPLIRAATATLQRDMPGQVAAFNAEQANTVQIEAPATYHFGAQVLLSAYAFPQCEIAAVAGDTGNFAVGRSEVDHDPRVNVALWVQGDKGDAPELYEQTLGLARCAIECLTPAGAFGPEVEIADGQGIAYRIDGIPFDLTANTPAQGRDFSTWLGSALLQFHLLTVEHFT